MQKNFNNFSMQDIMRLASSPAGKQLISLLQQADPETLRKAKAQASSGDYSQISQTLAPLLESEDVKKIMQQMEGQ